MSVLLLKQCTCLTVIAITRLWLVTKIPRYRQSVVDIYAIFLFLKNENELKIVANFLTSSISSEFQVL